jgi:hypothetical protein
MISQDHIQAYLEQTGSSSMTRSTVGRSRVRFSRQPFRLSRASSKKPITRRSYSFGRAVIPPVCDASGISQIFFRSSSVRPLRRSTSG